MSRKKHKINLTKIDNNIYVASLAVNQQPKVKVDTIKKIVTYGDKNAFPSHLLYLFENHAEHGGIVKKKAAYLSGLSIKAEIEDNTSTEFLKHANAKESWYEIRKKANLDKVIFGGFALKVLSNFAGKPLEWSHIEWARIRFTECGEFVKYSDDWDDRNKPVVTFPIWKEGIVQPSIYIHRDYSPAKTKLEALYPKQEYGSALLDIDTDIEVSNCFNKLVKNGFSAGTVITLPKGGNMTEAAEKSIVERIQGNHAGSDAYGSTVVLFVPKDMPEAKIASIPTNGLDKQFQEVTKRNKDKIIRAHEVPPMLYGEQTPGTLAGRTELDLQQEQHLNDYAKPQQAPFNQLMGMFYKLKFGLENKFEVEQLPRIGVDIPESLLNTLNAQTKEAYIKKKYGIEIIGETPLPNANDVSVQQAQVNEHLKGLTGKQRQDLAAIVRQFTKGQLSETQAVMRMAAYGFNEVDAKKYLGIESVQMALQLAKEPERVKMAIQLFSAAAHDENTADEILEEVPVHFKNATDALKFELSKQKIFLEKGLSVAVTDLRNAILNQLKGNPALTQEEIARILNTEVATVQAEMEWLTEKGLIESTEFGFSPTDKGFDRNTSKTKVEIYTEYKYGLKEGVPALVPGGSSREFCKELMSLSRSGKRWSFEKIDAMENEFGESAWSYRGGFYNNPVTGEITPDCRHTWYAVTKKRFID